MIAGAGHTAFGFCIDFAMAVLMIITIPERPERNGDLEHEDMFSH